MRREIRSVIDIEVLFHETDMLGIVHNSVYFQWFERGRLDILNRIIPIQEAISMGIAVLVVKNSCEYHTPARYGDTLVLTTRAPWADSYQGRLRFMYELTDKRTKSLVAVGESEATVYDVATQKLVREIPAALLERIRALLNSA